MTRSSFSEVWIRLRLLRAYPVEFSKPAIWSSSLSQHPVEFSKPAIRSRLGQQAFGQDEDRGVKEARRRWRTKVAWVFGSGLKDEGALRCRSDGGVGCEGDGGGWTREVWMVASNCSCIAGLVQVEFCISDIRL
ncbi:hypothetical protein O6H91_Y030200 [Diphasiastrum complanatum]|nr:hypothetical protein O6H91_Y030200 [Diphasiastrum complanatum]